MCLHVSSTAPQDDRKSEITYFKIQPVVKDNSAVDASNTEQNITENPSLKPVVDVINKTDSLNQSATSETEVLSEPITEVGNETKTDKRAANIDNFPNALDVNNNQSDANKDVASSEKTEEIRSNENTDNVPSETKAEREARNFEDLTTSSYENLNVTEKPKEVIEDTKTSPVIAPKTSYFKKFGGSSLNKNLIENQGKRRFRSKCRCEKIWNCPKLQISVPRCPEEQFMCCF